jgi:hypothetical protein
MTRSGDRWRRGARWTRPTMLRHLVAIPLVFALANGTAWGYWSAGSSPGGNGASADAAVNQGAIPTATAAGHTVTVSWSATTLTTGQAVSGYAVKRYSGSTMQTLLTACTGTIAGTSCLENNVPAGTWTYTVTPVFATNWQGLESAKSSTLTVAAPTLVLSPAPVKPGTSTTGTAAGFVGGETLQYRLDAPTGTLMAGSLAGSATPATIPGGGGGSVIVTVPLGTSDGAHTVYAVASPSGDTAAAGIVVDGTAPPLPVLTLTPTATSGDTVTFAYTEAESSATVDCNLDGAAYATCSTHIGYAGLAAGSHTFQARATDTVGNVSAPVSYTWTVDLTVPTINIAFPTVAGLYNDSGFNVGCGTAATGDACGSADDDVAVTGVSVSLRRLSTGLWWNGTSFSAAAETWIAATGTSSWSYAIAASAFAEGDFTLRAQATDGANFGYDARTFTVDRTAPAAPTLTSVPPATSGASATFAFTDSDPAAGFECQRDGGAWTSCASPQTYSTLANGTHTVAVRAVDGAGNTSASTSTTWTVDATAPTGAMTFPIAASYNLAGWAAGCGTPATGDLCGTASDVGSGLTAIAVSIRRIGTNSYWDGTAFAGASETWLGATGTATWSYPFAGTGFPADGTYTVRWRATDAVGNTTTGSVDLTLDTAPPPAPLIVQAPSDPSGASVQFDFTDAETGTSAECRIDAGSWATCTGPVGYSGLAAGSHTFGVRATDAAGNVTGTTSYTWTVNIGLPTISIGFPAPGRAYNNTTYAAGCGTPGGDLCGTASDPQGTVTGVAVSIRNGATSLYWNGASFGSATEVFLPATGTTSWSYAMAAASFPTEGSYTLRARATNNVALTGFDTLTITIDRTAPAAPTITAGPTGTTAGADTFSFTAEAGATFECRLDGGTFAACTSPKTNGALVDGSHTFDVRAVDGAGNTGATTSRTWTIDGTAPTIATTFPVAATRYNNTTYNNGCGTAATGDLCGTAADAASGVATVEISVQRASTGLYLTGTTFSAASPNWITATGTTSWSYALAAATFPGDGTYTLVVRATDAVGNASTASTAFVIDRTQPTAVGFSTTNVSTASRLELGDTFTLTYSEAIAPGSIISGWNGTTTQNVVVHLAGSGQANDKLTIYDSTNLTLLPLGTVNLNRTDYVTGMRTFGLPGSATLSTLTISGSSLTIRLGTASAATTTAAAAGNASWTPNALTTDLAGNATATTVYTETDLDVDF